MAENNAEKAYRLGKEYEQTYTGCSQCVIAALQDVFNIRNDDIFKSSTGLAAGGGSTTDGSCGAYAGATMIISYLKGRDRDNFDKPELMLENFGLIMKLRDRFLQEYGSVTCRDIQTRVLGRPYYLPDDDEFEKFEKAGAHAVHCPEVVGKAARWAAELIDEEKLAK